MPKLSHAGAIKDTAKASLGFDHLRPGQQQAITSVLDGHDTLSVMPTGSGKSAIYQIAGLILGGVTIVVSPLIALQRDQVESLSGGNVNAAELNSTLSNGEREALLERLEETPQIFLFLAPEQLANDETREHLSKLKPALIVVDEAHCISEWGHDFRPNYLRLGIFIEALGHPVTLALTATAAGPVRDEIIDQLNMHEPNIFVREFDRPNIRLAVESFTDDDGKLEALIDFASRQEGSGIIYAATRQQTEDIAAQLGANGISATAYHAGLKASDRSEVQDAFMRGEITVMVATIAFGMGIDKADIRYVCHYSISDSLDSYYQEIGRAGRDIDPAEALLLYNPEDLKLRRFQSGVGELKEDDVRPVLITLREADDTVDPTELREELELRDSSLGRLEDVDAVEIEPTGEIKAINIDEAVNGVAHAAAEAQEHLQHFASSRLEMMRQFAETPSCRRELLLNYFGDPYEGPCGNCDRCEQNASAPSSESDRPFPLQSTVKHISWGEGTVMHYEDGRVVVLFGDAGYRTLDLVLVQENKLLEFVS